MFQNKLKEHTLKEKARDGCLAFSFSMKRSMKREIRKFTLWSCEGNVPKVISRCRLRSDDGILLSHPNFKTLKFSLLRRLKTLERFKSGN